MTRQYDFGKSSESAQQDSDNWILQRKAVRKLPTENAKPQTQSQVSVRSDNKLGLMQIPIGHYDAQPSPLQALTKEPNKRVEETESQRLPGNLAQNALGEEDLTYSPTRQRNTQFPQLQTGEMLVVKSEEGFGGTETPLQRQEKEKEPENKTGLPDRLKEGIESLSGMDLSGVRVNYNSPKPSQVNAHAYTQGQAIEVAPGQEQHLPHEAWHVVQQMQNRVRQTQEVNGIGVNDNRSLEQEADAMGEKAKQYRQVTATESFSDQSNQTQLMATKAPGNQKSDTVPIQRKSIKGGGKVTGTVTYKTGTIGTETVANFMEAKAIKSKTGELGKDNEPQVSIPGWNDLSTWKLTKNPPQYKRMHLLNGQLGGNGKDKENLAPGSSWLNRHHHSEVERHLQSHVQKGGEIEKYSVICTYRNAQDAKTITDASKRATYQLTLKSLQCDWKFKGGKATTKTLKETPKTAKAWN